MDGASAGPIPRSKPITHQTSETKRPSRIQELGKPSRSSQHSASQEQDSDREKRHPKDKRTSSHSKSSVTASERRDERSQGSILPASRSAASTSGGYSILSRFSSLWSPSPLPQEQPLKAADSSKDKPRNIQRSATDLEGFLLQPAEDSRIASAAANLERSISAHIYNYYSCSPRSCPNQIFQGLIDGLDEDFRFPSDLLDLESFRLAALRRLFAQTIVQGMMADGDPENTLLPKEIVALLSMTSNQCPEKLRFAGSSTLRRIAGNLMRLQQRGENQKVTEHQYIQVKWMAQLLHQHFTVLAAPGCNEQARIDQLIAIVKKAAELGVLLLLQPETYEFLWRKRLERSSTSNLADKTSRSNSDFSFVVFPALIKMGDSADRRMRWQEIYKAVLYDEED
ncbi:MAG: hypothetical protein Q9191_006936 [Dirinaria sp. TL-2023a]